MNDKYNLMEICTPKQWKTVPKKDLTDHGYPLYGANGIIGYYNEYTHEKPTICITCRGATSGEINISKPFSYINGNAMALDNLDEDKINIRFLYYFLKSRGLSDTITGSAQPQITRTSLSKIFIPKISMSLQVRIVEILDKAKEVTTIRQQQLQEMDRLMQSYFIKMFGDPIGSSRYPKMKFEDLFEILDGDRGKNYPKKNEFHDEEHCLFLNTKNVTSKGWNFNNTQFITQEKDALLRKGKAQREDLIVTTRGTVGNIVKYDDRIPYDNVRINSGRKFQV